MKTIDQAKLLALLSRIRHATPVGLIALTDARPRKTGLPYSEVRKLTRLNAMIGTVHEDAVRRQQEREGQPATFVASPRAWGTRVGDTPLVEHRGQFYLSAQMNPLNRPRPLYLVPKARGKRTILTAVPKEAVAPWLPPERDEGASQGVDRPVTHREFRLDSIVSLTLNGEHYRVRPQPALIP